MPQAVVALATVVAANVGIVSTAGALAFLTSAAFTYTIWGVTIASVFAYSSAQRRKLKKAAGAAGASALDQGRSTMVRDPMAPRRLIYGEVQVSGTITFWHQQTGGGYHYMVLTLAAHECAELGTIKLDNEAVTLDGSGNVTSGTYAGLVQIRKYTGLAAGERDTTWESEIGTKWTSDHIGKNIARLHIRLKWSADKFPNGIPLITCLVKGAKVYDPREAGHDPDDSTTWEWSNNAALCTADFLNRRKGIAWSRIVEADLITAANVCDEVVVLDTTTNAGSFVTGETYEIETVGTTDFTAIGAASNTIGVQFTAIGAGSGTGVAYNTEKRYTCNGTYTYDQNATDALEDFAATLAGSISDPGGLWVIKAGAWTGSVLTLTDSDIVSSFRCVPRQSRQDTFNGVRGTYFSPLNDWAPADFPAVKNDTYMGWDGNVRLWKDVTYPYITSYAQAQRVAKIDLEVGRQQIIVEADFTLKAMKLRPGDVVSYTRARLGWSSKYFEVIQWQLKITQSATGPALAVGLTLRETAEGVYDWNDGEETTVDLAANTGLDNPRTVETPTGLTLNSASYTVIQPDGTVIPKIRVSWTAPSAENILSGGFTEIEYKQSASGTWLSWADNIEGAKTEDYITDVKAGVNYDVRIRFRNVKGVRGAYATSSGHTVAGDTTAPSTPTGLTATGTLESITLKWDASTDPDYSHDEVWRHTSDSSGSATKVGEIRGNQFVDTLPSGTTTYYYWLKRVDYSGNKSGFTSSVNASANSQSGGGTGSVTVTWHSSGLGGGYINGNYYSGTSTTVTGLSLGLYVTVQADDPVSGYNWTSWGGSNTGQLESGTGTNPNRILIGGAMSIIANYDGP